MQLILLMWVNVLLIYYSKIPLEEVYFLHNIVYRLHVISV